MEQQENPDLSPLIIDGPPWEKKHELGFFVAFVETIKAFLFYPAKAFSVMRRIAGISDALVYTVSLQVFSFLWNFALGGADPQSLLPQDPAIVELLQLPPNFARFMILIYPFSVILLGFISALSFHLALKWRHEQLYEFQLVFRIFAYASGTASILFIIPGIGGLISVLLTIWITYVGIRTIYGLDMFAFTVASLVALLVAIGLYLVFAFGLTILIIMLSLLV
jgi:hypothetical protein